MRASQNSQVDMACHRDLLCRVKSTYGGQNMPHCEVRQDEPPHMSHDLRVAVPPISKAGNVGSMQKVAVRA